MIEDFREEILVHMGVGAGSSTSRTLLCQAFFAGYDPCINTAVLDLEIPLAWDLRSVSPDTCRSGVRATCSRFALHATFGDDGGPTGEVTVSCMELPRDLELFWRLSNYAALRIRGGRRRDGRPGSHLDLHLGEAAAIDFGHLLCGMHDFGRRSHADCAV